MLDWLLLPIDATRAHVLTQEAAWHGRLMVLGWGVLCPLGVLVARFGKIWPGQDWPRELDRKTWWHAHLVLQYCGSLSVLIAVLLISRAPAGLNGSHAMFGWTLVAFTTVQVLSGLLRGSKGGPTAPHPDGSLHGDHYVMTPRRRLFEYSHKLVGSLALLVAVVALGTGLWTANAPRWMWLAVTTWWVTLAVAAIVLQKRGLAVDTYQAIWGADHRHPGNTMQPIGLGIRRLPPAGDS